MMETLTQRYRRYRGYGHGRVSSLMQAAPPETILIGSAILGVAIGLFSTWGRQ
jgi:hypothetical protein